MSPGCIFERERTYRFRDEPGNVTTLDIDAVGSRRATALASGPERTVDPSADVPGSRPGADLQRPPLRTEVAS